MIEKIKRRQRSLLVGLIVVCMGVMVVGAVVYLKSIEGKLRDAAIKGVMDVTIQQRQAFENFISGDRERLHSYAGYFAGSEGITQKRLPKENNQVYNHR